MATDAAAAVAQAAAGLAEAQNEISVTSLQAAFNAAASYADSTLANGNTFSTTFDNAAAAMTSDTSNLVLAQAEVAAANQYAAFASIALTGANNEAAAAAALQAAAILTTATGDDTTAQNAISAANYDVWTANNMAADASAAVSQASYDWYVATLGPINPNVLTVNTDTFSFDGTTVGLVSGLSTTLQAADTLTGGAGFTDELAVMVQGAALELPGAFTMSAVEYLTVYNANTNFAEFDLTNVTGLSVIGVTANDNQLSIQNVQSYVDIELANVANITSDLSIGYAASVVAGVSDNQYINVRDYSGIVKVGDSVGYGDIETISIYSTNWNGLGTALNTISLTSYDVTTLNIDGDASLDLTFTTNASITNITQSAIFTGDNLSINTAANILNGTITLNAEGVNKTLNLTGTVDTSTIDITDTITGGDNFVNITNLSNTNTISGGLDNDSLTVNYINGGADLIATLGGGNNTVTVVDLDSLNNGVNITTLGGDDTFDFTNTSDIANLVINAGDGTNSITANNIFDGTITTTNGSDTIIIGNVSNVLTVDAGAGTNSITAGNVNSIIIDTTTGNDTVVIGDVTTDLNVDLRSGTNSLTIGSMTGFDGNSYINTTGGADTVVIDKVLGDSATDKLWVDLGDGANNFTINQLGDISDGTRLGRLDYLGGTGVDTVVMGTSIGIDNRIDNLDAISIATGDGDDNITFYGDGTFQENLMGAMDTLLTLDGGNGANTLTFANGSLDYHADALFANWSNIQTMHLSKGGNNLTLATTAQAAGLTNISLSNNGATGDTITLNTGYTDTVNVTLSAGVDTVSVLSGLGTLNIQASESEITGSDYLKGNLVGVDTLNITGTNTGSADLQALVGGFDKVVVSGDSTYLTVSGGGTNNGEDLQIDASALATATRFKLDDGSWSLANTFDIIGGHGNNDINLAASSGNQTVDLTASDTIVAFVASYENQVYLGTGVNNLTGGNNNNYIDSRGSASTITLGNGNNEISVLLATGSGGYDTVNLGNGSNTVLGSANHHITVNAGNGNNSIFGGDLSDNITVGGGGNMLVGYDGADSFFVTSAGNADNFKYYSNTNSQVGSGDSITGFTHGEDVIDLFGLTMTNFTVTSGVASLTTFNSGAGFDASAYFATDTHMLMIDSDGSGAADMEIELVGVATIDFGDFIV
jgi:hypothetical protein